MHEDEADEPYHQHTVVYQDTIVPIFFLDFLEEHKAVIDDDTDKSSPCHYRYEWRVLCEVNAE
jgi:hypothetical protein